MLGGCPQVCFDLFLSLQFSSQSQGHFLSSSISQPPELPLPQQLSPAQAAVLCPGLPMAYAL